MPYYILSYLELEWVINILLAAMKNWKDWSGEIGLPSHPKLLWLGLGKGTAEVLMAEKALAKTQVNCWG